MVKQEMERITEIMKPSHIKKEAWRKVMLSLQQWYSSDNQDPEYVNVKLREKSREGKRVRGTAMQMAFLYMTPEQRIHPLIIQCSHNYLDLNIKCMEAAYEKYLESKQPVKKAVVSKKRKLAKLSKQLETETEKDKKMKRLRKKLGY